VQHVDRPDAEAARTLEGRDLLEISSLRASHLKKGRNAGTSGRSNDNPPWTVRIHRPHSLGAARRGRTTSRSLSTKMQTHKLCTRPELQTARAEHLQKTYTVSARDKQLNAPGNMDANSIAACVINSALRFIENRARTACFRLPESLADTLAEVASRLSRRNQFPPSLAGSASISARARLSWWEERCSSNRNPSHRSLSYTGSRC
jgi:ribosome modulation factor